MDQPSQELLAIRLKKDIAWALIEGIKAEPDKLGHGHVSTKASECVYEKSMVEYLPMV